jgi:hypothetical protein
MDLTRSGVHPSREVQGSDAGQRAQVVDYGTFHPSWGPMP